MSERKGRWRGPTIREVSELSGLGTATVDRVLNDRGGVRPATRERVLSALKKLTTERRRLRRHLRFALVCESGESFNREMRAAADRARRQVPGITLDTEWIQTGSIDPTELARKIASRAEKVDGVLVVSSEHRAISAAIRASVDRGTPVVCLTTDHPGSQRSAYIGNDQHAAGSVAAHLIGSALPARKQQILLITSLPFRCQQEREMGFRRTLRSDFPHLSLVERVIGDDKPAQTRAQLRRHLNEHAAPAAMYNVAAGNRGVAAALEEAALAQRALFVGHELTEHARALLESGTMDYVISHDFDAEMRASLHWLCNWHDGQPNPPGHSMVHIHTRHNCRI